MSIESIEQNIRAKSQEEWKNELETIINPLRDRLPECLVEIGGRKHKAIEVFTALTEAVFKTVLPERQEKALADFVALVEKHKLEDAVK